MSAQNIRWLHLSDFHVGMDDYAQRRMFDYIISHVQKRKEDGFVPDFIFVTGDLADKGKSAEYETFWFEFLEPLQKIVGDGIHGRTFVIPGNHDVDRKLNPHFDRAEMVGGKSHCFDASPEGKALREMLMPRFKAFCDSDYTTAQGAFGDDSGAFAATVEIRGCKVGVAGINTAWLCKGDDDERKLTPGKGLLENALGRLGGVKLRIILGHHPIDWLVPIEQKPIKSLLGQHCVLYLHGHLHEVWAEPTYGGGFQFLSIQSGAGFQAREGERWKNGLVWGEADLSAQQVRLQPWRWIPDHQDWVIAFDAFHDRYRANDWWVYDLPGSENAKLSVKLTATIPLKAPKGWACLAPDELASHYVILDKTLATQFFNGSVPGWHIALSCSIPRREIVKRIVSRFQDANTAARPVLTLLLAAGCEGKTTAILQSCYEIVKDKSDWRILRRNDDAASLKVAEIMPILDSNYRWLVILDDADGVTDALFHFITQIPTDLQGKIHFLIACRDSDWQSSGAGAKNWSSICAFHQERLKGLERSEAEAIVQTWAEYGAEGLGDLLDVDVRRRGLLLEEQANEESKTNHGSFFGALLAVRHGSDLPNHARLMLERLGQRTIPSGGTLRDAFGFIAVMHNEGLEYLSRVVLAKALGCPLEKLHKDVLAPLGQEAAATSTSCYVYTRHRRVANAVVSVLEGDFGLNTAALFVSLGKAAIDTKHEGHFVPDLPAWRYEFARYFFDTSREELALEIARAVLASEPRDYRTLVNLANLYRKAKSPEVAVKLFRGFSTIANVEAGFFCEWSVCEGENGDQATSALLAAFSVSDDCPAARVSNENAKRGLAVLGVAFGELFKTHREIAFREGRMAIAVLGQQLELDLVTAGHFRTHLSESMKDGSRVPNVEEAFVFLNRGVVVAESIGVNKAIRPAIPAAASFSFTGLVRLINAAIEAKQG